jgi:F0F1-type ATP synthase beta subunit
MDGKIVSVKGPVVDVKFEENALPKINDALICKIDAKDNNAIVESTINELSSLQNI